MKENIIVASERVSENKWNNALRSAGVAGVLFQSTYWAEYLRKIQGDRPIYLFSENGKGNINGLLLAVQSCYGRFPVFNWGRFESPTGITLRKLYKAVLEKGFQKMLPFIYWQNGPVIIQQSPHKKNSFEHERTYRGLIEKILGIAEVRKCYAINFARPSYFMDRQELMSSYGFKKRRMGTILADVGQSVELIWKSIDRQGRRNIRKIENDITFAEVSKLSELKIFYMLHVQSTRRLKIKPYPFSHYKSLWNFFFPLGKIIAFSAFFKNKPIGAYVALMHGNMIHEYAYADSDFARSNRIYVNDALKWYVMKWAHERGFKYLDLSGAFFYRIDAGDKKVQNIYRFKSKFGKVIEFNDYWKLTDQSAFYLRAKCSKILNLFIPESCGCCSY